MSRVLIYSQDRGGANIVARLASRLAATGGLPPMTVFAHPMSESVFHRVGVAFTPLTAKFKRLPPSEDELVDWLKCDAISQVICTTSSRFVDMTNCRLITAARRLEIPTLSYLDHWIGFDRFTDESGSAVYLTDVIGCIDRYCAGRLEALGLRPENIHIVGHPHLEAIRDGASMRSNQRSPQIRICIVSQPSMRDRSFRGLFQERLGALELLDEMAAAFRAVEASGLSLDVRYRPHPKETGTFILPSEIQIDATPYDEKLCERFDVFIGATSMVLIEAAVAGRYTIRLDLPEWEDAVPEMILPESLPVTVTERAGFRTAVENVVELYKRGTKPPRFGGTFLQDALARACLLAERFMRSELRPVHGLPR